MTLHVVKEPERPFVCPWCAERFIVRQGLSEHWRENPECRENRNVNNSTPSKYMRADLIVPQPGEPTLFRVRNATCTHEERKPLVDEAGTIRAYQCMNCYAQLEDRT